MKESARMQKEIDKANFKAHKMEARAFYQEQKAKSNPEVRKMVQKQEYQQQMEGPGFVRRLLRRESTRQRTAGNNVNNYCDF